MQNLKRNWLVSSKLTLGMWRILTRALENLKHLHFNGLLLAKVYNVWAKNCIEELCLMALSTDEKFEGKLTCMCFQKMFIYRLKNSDFILESKWQNAIESRIYWFILKIARMFPILMSRNSLMNAFIIHATSMLFHSKKALLLPSLLPGTEYTWALIWKKSLIICF